MIVRNASYEISSVASITTVFTLPGRLPLCWVSPGLGKPPGLEGGQEWQEGGVQKYFSSLSILILKNSLKVGKS